MPACAVAAPARLLVSYAASTILLQSARPNSPGIRKEGSNHAYRRMNSATWTGNFGHAQKKRERDRSDHGLRGRTGGSVTAD